VSVVKKKIKVKANFDTFFDVVEGQTATAAK